MSVNSDDPRSRLFPPLITLVSMLVGVTAQRLHPLWLAGTVGRWIGGVVIAAAVALGVWAVLTFRWAGTTPDPHGETKVFVTTGPFRFSRNPMYLTNVLVQIGIALLLANAWILVLVPVTWLLLDRVVIVGEERYLASKYGPPFEEFCRGVRRWL